MPTGLRSAVMSVRPLRSAAGPLLVPRRSGRPPGTPVAPLITRQPGGGAPGNMHRFCVVWWTVWTMRSPRSPETPPSVA
ncbi:protein of unknown function [Streptomyces sp. KY70]|nr:protein of unknown function [Streptomyces sp. KY70]